MLASGRAGGRAEEPQPGRAARAARRSACGSAPSRCSCRSWPGPALAFARGLRAGRRAGLAPAEGAAHGPADAGAGRRGRWRCAVLRAVGGLAAPVEPAGAAGRAAARRRQARRRRAVLRPGARGAGLERARRAGGAARLGFAPVGRAPTQVWRREAEPTAPSSRRRKLRTRRSPFAALAALQPRRRAGAAAAAHSADAMAEEAVPGRRLAVARALLQDPLAGRAAGRGRPGAPRPAPARRRASTRPRRPVKAGDGLVFAIAGRLHAVRIEALGVRRGPPAEARALYSPRWRKAAQGVQSRRH